jgi:hypothetical protein
LGHIAAQHLTSFKSSKHFKCSTYNDFIEWYNGETINDNFDVNVAEYPATRTEFSKYQALHVTIGWIWFIGWYKEISDLKRSNGIMQTKAEADTGIHDCKGLYDYKASNNTAFSS